MESSSGEGGRESVRYVEIETGMESLDKSTIFHLLREILGFVLYMHHQIPAVLQCLQIEFDSLKQECKNLESTLKEKELKMSSRRKHNGRMREVKYGIRKQEKLMSSISNLLSALQLILLEVPDIQGVVLVLGSSLLRPQHVYEMFFSHGKIAPTSGNEFHKSKAADAFSKKAIRTLISNGAGAVSYAGPAKLFLLVKAPATLKLSQHFLPKRDFRYNKKTVPLRLQIKCRSHEQGMDLSHSISQIGSFTRLQDSSSTDTIWFQCKHTIKGLPSKDE